MIAISDFSTTLALLAIGGFLVGTSRGRMLLGRVFLRVSLTLLALSHWFVGSNQTARRRLSSASSEISWALQALPGRHNRRVTMLAHRRR